MIINRAGTWAGLHRESSQPWSDLYGELPVIGNGGLESEEIRPRHVNMSSSQHTAGYDGDQSRTLGL